MRTLIVDDEPLARSRLKRLLADYPNIECVGEASGADEALSLVEQLNPDLVMLDIEMPGEDGLSIAERLNQRAVPPAIILVTAHPEHALDAYRVGPSDYLLKPVDPKRLKIALERVSPPKLSEPLLKEAWVTFKRGEVYHRIHFDKVMFFAAEDGLVRMVYEQGEAILEDSLKQIEARFRDETIRIHRHLLINRMKVIALQKEHDKYFVKMDGYATPLEVSRRRVKQVKQALLRGRL